MREMYVRQFCEAVRSGVAELGWTKEKAVATLVKAEITVEDLVRIGDSEIESWMRKAQACGYI